MISFSWGSSIFVLLLRINSSFSVLGFFFSWNLFILTGDEDSNLRFSTECFSGEKQAVQYTPRVCLETSGKILILVLACLYG